MINGNTFNCGHCQACRINLTSQWTLRLLYELDSWDAASFLTLTYDDEHVPLDFGLRKRDLQLFNKRLRSAAWREFGLRLKYYSVGEYGSVSKRPHYHGIYYGIDSSSALHRQLIKDCWPYCPPWQFDDRGDKKGVGDVTHDSIQYVTGYVRKKLSGEMAKNEYGDLQRPFSLVSRGLGLDFALAHKDRLLHNGYTYIRGQKIGLPRYLRDKLGLSLEFTPRKDKIESFKEEMEFLTAEFYKQNPQFNDLTFSNLENVSRAFQRWYDNRRWATADIIEQNFLQRSKKNG